MDFYTPLLRGPYLYEVKCNNYVYNVCKCGGEEERV
jgi:hypothetical protein